MYQIDLNTIIGPMRVAYLNQIKQSLSFPL